MPGKLKHKANCHLPIANRFFAHYGQTTKGFFSNARSLTAFAFWIPSGPRHLGATQRPTEPQGCRPFRVNPDCQFGNVPPAPLPPELPSL
jgi:hypothetical protein